MANRSANVVVIGGGVNGTSIAMHLARMGAGKVLLLEKGHLAGGASGRSGAMVREHYLHPTLVKMAVEASTIFHNFDEIVGGDARFTETGRMLLFPERDVSAVRANVEMNLEFGVNIQTLALSEVAEIVPQANLEGIALGVYEPTSGYADPVATTYAYANRARDYGAEIVTGVRRQRYPRSGRAHRRSRYRGRASRGGRRCRGDRSLGEPACRSPGRIPSHHSYQGPDGASAPSAVS